MGRVIAVVNLKGGIGKTTTVVNLGAGLALRGSRVLLVDTDAQGNLAMALGAAPRRSLYEVLIDGADPNACVHHARPNLDLLAADATLLGAVPAISTRPDWSRALSKALRPAIPNYDIILIDSGGSLTPMNINALTAASEIIAPTTVEPFAIRGVEMLIEQLAKLHGGALRMIVPTMYDPRTRQSEELLATLRATHGDLVAPPVRVNVRLSESQAHGQTIYEYDPRSRGAADYANLVEHVVQVFNIGQPAARPAPTAPSRPLTAPGAPPAATAAPLPAPRPAAPPPRALPTTCPNCGRPIKLATAAGYRVAFCESCHFHTQVLLRER